ncbi:MAG TPA: PCRF domain-containing protein, partial [Verrucomicrobiota bacterium]|nr:PCRF domain-containing protein [Verrucomicrobiota bacterium]
MDLRPQIEKFAQRFAEVETALSDPKAFNNPQRAQELGKEYARLRELMGQGQAYAKVVADLAENRALLEAEPAESELALLAREEITRLEAEEK